MGLNTGITKIPGADANWKPAILGNGWVDFGSGFAPPRFRKYASGLVEMQGVVRSGSADGIFVLPVGYRPSMILLCPAISSDGALVARMDINPDGWVMRMVGSTTWFSIKCVFYADQ